MMFKRIALFVVTLLIVLSPATAGTSNSEAMKLYQQVQDTKKRIAEQRRELELLEKRNNAKLAALKNYQTVLKRNAELIEQIKAGKQ